MNTEIALWRTVPFVIGVYIGSIIHEGKNTIISPLHLVVFGFVLKILYIFLNLINVDIIPSRFVSCFWGISIAFCISFLFQKVKCNTICQIINNSISCMTLELYLTTVLLRASLTQVSVPTEIFFVFCGYVLISFIISFYFLKLKNHLSFSKKK